MKTPIDNQHWLLDSIAGWQEAPDGRNNIALTQGDGALTLEPLPGRGELLIEEDAWEATGLVCPSALAADPCGGRLLVADAATHLIKQIDLVSLRVQTLPAIGVEGSTPRALRTPRGLACLRSGILALSDTGNHRIQIFSPAPHAQMQLWDEPNSFRWPWGIAADACGVLHIADRGHGRIRRRRRDGTMLKDLGKGRLRAPTRVAISSDGRIAVVDHSSASVLVFFSPDRAKPWSSTEVIAPRAVAFDNTGRLYVGDANGFVHVLEPVEPPGNYKKVPEPGDTGIPGEIIDLAWLAKMGLIAIIHEKREDGVRVRLWKINPAGAFIANGSFTTEPIDSGIDNCQWHRVLLDAEVPPKTSLEIECSTSNKKEAAPEWKRCLLAGGDDEPPNVDSTITKKPAPPDCLVQSGLGQFLSLRLTFKSNGVASPQVRSLKAFYPRDSYLQYLPSVFQEDEESREFLERFLSIFQTEFDTFDHRIDTLWQLFDPDSVPELHFSWLASWLGLLLLPESNWSWEKKREMLTSAIADYRRRGTIDGVQKTVADYAGVPWTMVLEHFKLRRWPALSIAAPLDGSAPLWSRDFYRRLQESMYSQVGFFRLTGTPEPALEPLDWGAHRFTIFFPTDPYRIAQDQQKVARVVEREKPAHTFAELCPVLPRFRVGVQAMIGFDTMVGDTSNLVLSQVATLGYDTILACTPAEQQLRALGTAVRPRVGVSTKIS
jgi:phage tail-like protein